MRHVSAMTAVTLLLIGCAQLGGARSGDGGAGSGGVALKPNGEVCQAVSNAVGKLDAYLNRLGEINLCLQGVPDCPTKDKAKKACELRDHLADFHADSGCTDQMLGPRPQLCSRL